MRNNEIQIQNINFFGNTKQNKDRNTTQKHKNLVNTKNIQKQTVVDQRELRVVFPWFKNETFWALSSIDSPRETEDTANGCGLVVDLLICEGNVKCEMRNTIVQRMI